VCSVDAHGLTSNYSEQKLVSFDVYKNKLFVEFISVSGSPRQYPNMNLNLKAFKDVIKLRGDETKNLDVYFSPEYFQLYDSNNQKIPILELQKNYSSSQNFYMLQLINLDNQKTQLIKIDVKDYKNTVK
jgi:hypothetical protein